jgi:hypothetical protein
VARADLGAHRAPTRLVWWLLLGACLAAAAAVLAMPETVLARPGVLAALRPRVTVPRQARLAWSALAREALEFARN